jgi:hypothetical protein
MLYALRTALKASDMVGSIGVITHPLDDGVRAFYRSFAFEDLPSDPRRAMMVRMVDLSKSGISNWLADQAVRELRASGTADTEFPTILTWSTAKMGKSKENQLAGGGGFEPPLRESESVLDR